MTPNPISFLARGLNWLLTVAFILAPLPLPAAAQDEPVPEVPPAEAVLPEVPPPEAVPPEAPPAEAEPPEAAPAPEAPAPEVAPPEAVPAPSPVEAARARIQRLRAVRAGAPAAAPAEEALPETPELMPAGTTAEGEAVY